MPNDNDKKYRPKQRHIIPNDEYARLCKSYNESYLPEYNLEYLTSDEKARLFNVLFIATARSYVDGVFAEHFVRAVFEEVRDIVHGVPPYDKKISKTKIGSIKTSGYTKQMSAIIRYYYDG